MTFTYTWLDAKQTVLVRSDGASVPADPGNRDYQEFLASGVIAAPYVAPTPAAPPTTAEKLAAAGLTVDELKALLAS